MSRILSRDLLFKLTFETLFVDTEHTNSFEDWVTQSTIDKESLEFVRENFPLMIENKNKIETVIKNNLTEKFAFDRLFKIDLAILMLAVHELMFNKITPIKVIVNEAIELAKKYSTENSYSFINGVLAKIIKNEEVKD